MFLAAWVVLGVTCGCAGSPTSPRTDAGLAPDGGPPDSGAVHELRDGGAPDSGLRDAGERDAGLTAIPDAGPRDGGSHQLGVPDSGLSEILPQIPPIGPLVMVDQGGPLISAAQLVTIDYEDFPYDAEVQQFGDFLPGSRWLQLTGAPYGVGLVGHTHYTLPGPSPSFQDLGGLVNVVQEGLDAGWWPASPGDGGQPIWLFLLPTLAIHGFAGQHGGEAGDAGLVVVAYAELGIPPNDTLPWLEDTASHEVIEALTDPLVTTAYTGTVDGIFAAFQGGIEAEVADVCEATAPVEEDGFTLARAWSNAASLDGGDPCEPTQPGGFIGLRGPDGPITAPYAQFFSIPLIAVADDPGAQWELTSTLFTPLFGDLSPTQVTPGQRVTLTVEIPAGTEGPLYVVIDSQFADGGIASQWPIELLPE